MKSIGIAVIGSGRIGTLRASLSAAHPGVNFLAVSDREKHKADILAQRVGANLATTDNLTAINHPSVSAVFVSTPEHDHREAVVQALDERFPGLRFRIVDEQDRVRRHIHFFVGDELVKRLDHPVPRESEVMIVCALSGG